MEEKEMIDKRLMALGSILEKFAPEEPYLCLGAAKDRAFLFADKETDPRFLMAVIEAVLENNEWLRMVITGAVLGLMSTNPEFKAIFFCGLPGHGEERKE